MTIRARQSAVDTVLGVAVGAMMLLVMLGVRRGGRGGREADWFTASGTLGSLPAWARMAVVIGAVACVVAVSTRRVWPVGSWVGACVGVALYLLGGGWLPPAVAGLALVLYTAVRRIPGLTMVALGSLAPIAIWAKFWTLEWLGLVEPLTWVSVLASTAWVIAPAAVGLALSGRKAATAQRRADELRQAALDERLRIARDIHDVVGHSLSLIALQSGVALRVLDANPGQARESLEAIRSASTTSMDELRRTLATFRGDAPADLAPQPGLADIAALVAAVSSTGRVVKASVSEPVDIPASVQLVAHRVVQEALTNAVRHAPGAVIEVSVGVVGDRLVVRVADDGPPVPALREGNGLLGMRERVASVGGTLDVSSPGGVVVSASLPLGGPP